ncbi:MAG: hypothetical protein ACLGSH_08070 [Acidobacteriota bacterium]
MTSAGDCDEPAAAISLETAAPTRSPKSFGKHRESPGFLSDSGNKKSLLSPAVVQLISRLENFVKERLQRVPDVLLSGPFKKV